MRISLNSLWSTAWLDLDKELIILPVPETNGRYYVFSATNMWTNVFASIGKRTTATSPGNFLLAGPKWKGEKPADVQDVFRSSTAIAGLLRRSGGLINLK